MDKPAALPSRTAYHLLAIACTALLLAALLPLLLRGWDAVVTVHDQLDGEFLYLVLLARTGTLFHGNAVLPQVMNGLPRRALRSGFDATAWWFAALPPFRAFVANYVTVHLTAFAGMYLLLRRHVLPGRNRPEPLLLATAFAVVPFYTLYGLSVAGQPLLLFALLNIGKNRSRWFDWAILIGVPFYSQLVLSGLFIVVAAGLLGAWWIATGRTLPARYWAACVVLAAGYVATAEPLIQGFLSGSFVSHRVEFRLAGFRDASLHGLANRAWSLLSATQYHTGAFTTIPIIVCAAIAAAWSRSARTLRLMTALGAAILLIVVTYAVYEPVVIPRLGRIVPAARLVHERFYWLLPVLWFVLLGAAARALRRHGRAGLALVGLTCIVVAADALRRSDEFVCNVGLACPGMPTFRQFFAPGLFARIDSTIGRPQSEYRVVSVGLHPAIAQFNGFYTLDSYQSNYPLAYKHRFRAVIAGELARSARLRQYYDDWGSRVYVFSSELRSLLMPKNSVRPIQELQINTGALREMGAGYLISAAAIRNAPALGLVPMGVFESPTSFWRLHLYRIRPAAPARVRR